MARIHPVSADRVKPTKRGGRSRRPKPLTELRTAINPKRVRAGGVRMSTPRPAGARVADSFQSYGKTCSWMHTASDSAHSSLRPHEAADSRTARIRVVLDRPVGVAIIAIALLAPSIVWIFRDVRVWSWDPAYYGAL